MINTNPKPVIIKTTPEELGIFVNYIAGVQKNLHKISGMIPSETKFFLIWHLAELKYRVLKIVLNNINELPTKKMNFKVNLAEQKTFSIVFSLLPSNDPYLLIMQNKLISGLVNSQLKNN